MMKKKRWGFKQSLSMALAVSLAAGAAASNLLPGSILEAEAMQRPGTAPYINTWLVAGPSDYSVTEEIYSGAASGRSAGNYILSISDENGLSQGDVSDSDFSDVSDSNLAGKEVSGGNLFSQQDLPAAEGSKKNAGLPEESQKLDFGTLTASTVLNNDNSQFGADKAADGDPETKWKSNTVQGWVWDNGLSLTADLKEVSTVSGLRFIPQEKDGKKIDVIYRLLHKSGVVLETGTIENLTPGVEYEAVLGKPLTNVSKIVFIPWQRTDSGNVAPNHLGFAEVEAWGTPGVTGDGEVEAPGDISPVMGEKFGDTEWQYFDDRIFNRNTDDYQDLYGYFQVKQGLEVSGRYTYAHTYVYSEAAQDAQLRFVTSGLHKAYVNDILIDQNTTAVESSNKDQYIQNIRLKQGWNKILFEIRQDRVRYLGFYARISDSNGDEVPGLTYSTAGGNVSGLTITTQGLSIDKAAFDRRNEEAGLVSNQYPDNEMPNGYVDWPYVWNKALQKVNAGYAPQASRFQFEAAGGAPGYKWQIIKGSLPEGLTMSEDGRIDGFCKEMGEYAFTIQVTDAAGNTAVKDTKIAVKERPSKWFEEGKMSALSHNTGAYTQFYDPNFSFDLWAERAKDAGMTMLSTEAVQGVYYWPAPGSFPGDPNGAAQRQHPYTTEVVDGVRVVKDMVGMAKEAAERHGLRFGVYYASEGSNRIVDGRVNNSGGFFDNVEDLMKRYDPSYLFFDGNPENKGNVDAMWSAVRAYNDYALIQANDQNEVGDNDLTIQETEYTGKPPYIAGGHWENNMWNQNKYTVEEAWTHPFVKEVDGWSGYAGGHMRDDWRLFAEYIIYNVGHGIVANYDQMIVSNRGVNWNGINYNCGSPDVYYYYPLNAQKFIDIRENVNAWLANEGKPDLRESLYGTMPYYFDTYEKKDGWHENTEKEPFLTAKYGEGPEWGYSVSRDQFVYMHMTENTIGQGRAKKGFTGQDSIYVGPFTHNVIKVEWLNEGKDLSFTAGDIDGKKYITIDTSSVETDPVDTILKITTDNPERGFQLTGVKLFSSQDTGKELQLRAEAYLKDFTSVFADADLEYTSEDTGVAAVDQNGLVKPVRDGRTVIHVTASYEGKSARDTYAVQVKNGEISAAEELDSVVLRTDGKEVFGLFSTNRSLPVTLEGRTEKGGGTDILSYDSIKWHYGVCSGDLNPPSDSRPEDPDSYWHAREVDSTSVLKVENDEVIFNGPVTKEENIAIWAEVAVDGRTYTTNMNYLRIRPQTVVSNGAEVTVTSGGDGADLTDGVLNSADGGNTSRWTPGTEDKDPSVTIRLGNVCEVDSVTAYFNNKDRYYMNTPAGIRVEASEDGRKWNTTVENGSVPDKGTKYAYEDEKYTYPVNQKAQYIRVTFPGGARENTMDVLELQVNGVDISNILTDLEIEPKQLDDKTAALVLTGYSGDGSIMNLSGAEIRVTSGNEEVISIDGKQQLNAVAQGRAQITVEVTLKGSRITRSIYANVNQDGKLYFGDYLKEVLLSLDSTSVSSTDPVAAAIEGILNTGKPADMSKAEVEYIFSEKAPVAKLDGADVIYMPEETAAGGSATVQVKVTIDGITVTSNEVGFSVEGSNIAAGAAITVSSVRDRNGVPDGNNQDDRYLGSKAADGQTGTSWAAKQADKSPWIMFDFGQEKAIQKIIMVERGHDVNQVGEALLQFFDEEGKEVASRTVTDMKWEGQPENVVDLEQAVNASSIKITIDPEVKFHYNGSERGFAEVQVFTAKKEAKEIEAVNRVYVETEAGLLPELPGKATAVYSDLTIGEVEVAWDAVTEDMVAEEGIVTVEGSIAGTAVKARASINVLPATIVDSNKTLLKKTYEYAITLDTKGVVESAVKFFEDAKAEAKTVLENPRATQEEVNAAWNRLVDGIHGLGLYQGDKTMLGILISKAEEMLANEDKYVAEDWPRLLSALKAARDVMDDKDAMAEDVKEVQDPLFEAILAQRFKAEKGILEELIQKAQAIDESLYTTESVQVFRAARARANEVLADESLSKEDQPVVDQAAKDLEDAMLQLVKKDQDPSDPGEPEVPTDPDGPEGPDEPADPSVPEGPDEPADPSESAGTDGQPDSGAANENQNGEVISPKTGDAADFSIFMLAAAGALLACGAVWAGKRRREE